MKNASKVNNSIPTSTPAGETRKSSYSKFLTEKNAKNKAYYFILSHGLYDHFAAFCKNYHSDDPHRDCLNILISKI
jgi:hypothetical protein